MSRIEPVIPSLATGITKNLLDLVEKKYGKAPNITQFMANSPTVLEGYLILSDSLTRGNLTPQFREQIAIAVATANGCDYCLSAHTLIGEKLGLPKEELVAARQGKSSDPKANEGLRFVVKLVADRGWGLDENVKELKQAEFSDGDIIEIIATVSLNIFTNYLNHITKPEIDFPVIRNS